MAVYPWNSQCVCVFPWFSNYVVLKIIHHRYVLLEWHPGQIPSTSATLVSKAIWVPHCRLSSFHFQTSVSVLLRSSSPRCWSWVTLIYGEVYDVVVKMIMCGGSCQGLLFLYHCLLNFIVIKHFLFSWDRVNACYPVVFIYSNSFHSQICLDLYNKLQNNLTSVLSFPHLCSK